MTHGGTAAGRRWTRRAGRLASVLGVAAAVVGASLLVAWANRWYVAEMFARSAGEPEGADWWYVYDRLHQAHATLVAAVVALAVAGLLGAVGRRARSPRPGPALEATRS
ncbi:hypothetical protein FB00_05775 [Cellulosimicrobium funkei]|uniref:Uncharacterized protein n=1 Tax=Cellulosimicrobium funkei TaxID=264251 RepID=A0A0H2L6G4_9MICO|nr:hypothetical protein [Cellulosimicrobium funkei]KLN35797.1 hypothetical protein FB00_05775 [Cellulosimicrobium funkei]